jgi:hypothetical protein
VVVDVVVSGAPDVGPCAIFCGSVVVVVVCSGNKNVEVLDVVPAGPVVVVVENNETEVVVVFVAGGCCGSRMSYSFSDRSDSESSTLR